MTRDELARTAEHLEVFADAATTSGAERCLAVLREAESRDLFPLSWALTDLRELVAEGRGGSALARAEWRYRDTDNDGELRAVLADLRDRAQRVIDALDEPVSREGRRLLDAAARERRVCPDCDGTGVWRADLGLPERCPTCKGLTGKEKR